MITGNGVDGRLCCAPITRCRGGASAIASAKLSSEHKAGSSRPHTSHPAAFLRPTTAPKLPPTIKPSYTCSSFCCSTCPGVFEASTTWISMDGPSGAATGPANPQNTSTTSHHESTSRHSHDAAMIRRSALELEDVAGSSNSPNVEISPVQRMLAACSGSLLTSLLGKP